MNDVGATRPKVSLFYGLSLAFLFFLSFALWMASITAHFNNLKLMKIWNFINLGLFRKLGLMPKAHAQEKLSDFANQYFKNPGFLKSGK